MSDSVSTVEYREIPGWPGYRVGNDGTVWSGWPRKNPVRWKVRKQRIESRPGYTQYRHLSLRNKDKYRHAFVHSLVLEAFVGPKPEGMECLHGNDDPSDNRLENLRWGTRKENVAEQIAHGRFGALKRSKLSDDHVRLIRSSRDSNYKLAKTFGVSECHVRRIKNRESLKHVSEGCSVVAST